MQQLWASDFGYWHAVEIRVRALVLSFMLRRRTLPFKPPDRCTSAFLPAKRLTPSRCLFSHVSDADNDLPIAGKLSSRGARGAAARLLTKFRLFCPTSSPYAVKDRRIIRSKHPSQTNFLDFYRHIARHDFRGTLYEEFGKRGADDEEALRDVLTNEGSIAPDHFTYQK
jgi:hypothetical protein